MDVTSPPDLLAFAQKVLQGISAIEEPRAGEADLSLQLGLSIWMRQTRTEIDDALPAMLAMRSALLKASGMDRATEPVPLRGVDPRLDVLNLGGYLRRLVARVTAHAQGDGALMVDRALDYLRNGRYRRERSHCRLLQMEASPYRPSSHGDLKSQASVRPRGPPPAAPA
jgi:hypothetical protein